MPKAQPSKNDRIDLRVGAVCQGVGEFIEAWGFKSIQGRVWTLLALSRRPLSQTEIAQRLSVSRSLVHLTISELTGYGLVAAAGTERNAPYEARLDVWPTITDVMRSREWMLMEKTRVALEAAIVEADFLERVGELDDYDLGRMKLLLAMTQFAQRCLSAILAIRTPRAFSELRGWLERGAQIVAKLEPKIPSLI